MKTWIGVVCALALWTPAALYACVNNLLPIVDVGPDARLLSPDGGFAFSSIGTIGWPTVFDLNGDVVSGQLAAPVPIETGVQKQYMNAPKYWRVWTPDEVLDFGEYTVSFEHAETTLTDGQIALDVQPNLEPSLSVQTIEPYWFETPGGVQSCCRNASEYCFLDCSPGDHCTECWWSNYIYKPSLKVQFGSIPGPYIGKLILRHGDATTTTTFLGSQQSPVAHIRSDDTSQEPLCFRGQLLDASGNQVLETEDTCVPIADFPANTERQIDNNEVMSRCVTDPEVTVPVEDDLLDDDDTMVAMNPPMDDSGCMVAPLVEPSRPSTAVLLLICMLMGGVRMSRRRS